MAIKIISNDINRSLLLSIVSLLLLFSRVHFSFAEILADIKIEKCKITLEKTAHLTNYRLHFQCDEPYFQDPQSLTAFTLENPSRLVIDIKGVQLTAKDNILLKSDELNSLRMAFNDGKTRIVVDIKLPIRPLFFINKNDDGKSLDVNFALKVSSQNLTDATSFNYQEDIKGDKSNNNDNSANKQHLIDSSSETSGKNDVRTELKAVLFKSIGIPPRGGAFFDLKKIDRYTLTKENDKRFRLVIEKTKLASDNLLLPQYGPESVEGLEIILLREEGENIVATIYVKNQTTIAPYIVNGKLWIKVDN